MSDVGANGEGERVVRASRRADGTYRKERKIRDGYVPPDEQVAYVSRGKQYRMDAEKDPVPGLDTADVGAQKPVSKSAKKNAARKAKKSAETSNTSEEQRPAASTGGAKKSPVQSQQTASQPTQEGAHCQGASDDANEKRARALKKKIRQISELQDKQAGGAELTPEQKTKLDSLADLLSELEGLQLQA